MEHYFELPIAYAGAEHRFRTRLTTFGYNYKFYVIVDGKEWTFEKDEAHDLQMTSPVAEGNLNPGGELLQRIIAELERKIAH